MIPKKIHYCWFGGNPLPDSVKNCINSWKKFCPDYEIIEWNESNYDLSKLMKSHPYLQTARHKLVYLNFPNEIMRESLFYLKLNERQKLACYPFIQSIVYDWMKNYDSFARQIDTLQK